MGLARGSEASVKSAVASAAESIALVRVYWAEPGAGEFGEMQPLIVGTRRGAAVFIRPDVDSLGPDLAQRAAADVLLRDTIVYLTCLHELGHALGLALVTSATSCTILDLAEISSSTSIVTAPATPLEEDIAGVSGLSRRRYRPHQGLVCPQVILGELF